MLTFVIPFLAHVDPSYMNGTFAFPITDDLRYGVFGRYGYGHANMAFHQVPFKDFALLSTRQVPEHLTQVLSQAAIKALSPTFENPGHVVFAFSLGMV
jgi:hypothetical protein